MDIMLAGEDQSQADQPNSLAEETHNHQCLCVSLRLALILFRGSNRHFQVAVMQRGTVHACHSPAQAGIELGRFPGVYAPLKPAPAFNLHPPLEEDALGK
eukprot:scaffold43808_cov20-Tisochrysis_lutea.AAC.1